MKFLPDVARVKRVAANQLKAHFESNDRMDLFGSVWDELNHVTAYGFFMTV